MQRLPYLLLLILMLAGCDAFNDDDEPRGPVVTGVFVASQGNFSDANGSVTSYDPETGIASVEAIRAGTLVQSLLLSDSTLYVVGNSNGRVDLYDPSTLRRRASISGLTSPRYMAATTTHAFVTNLYADAAAFSGGSVSVLDLRSNAKVRDVTVGDNPEGVAISGSRVYVADSGFGNGSTVSVLDARTGDVTQTIDVDCDGPRSVIVDAENEVWVFCSGRTEYDENWNEVGQTNGAVRILEGATGRIIGRLDVDGPIGAASLGQDVFYSAASSEVFVVLGSARIARFSTSDNSARGEIALPDGAPIGAVAYDATREQLYVGRVTSYTAAGHVTIHNRSGAQTGRFEAGIVPTFITLREQSR